MTLNQFTDPYWWLFHTHIVPRLAPFFLNIFFLSWRQACHLPLQKISEHRNIVLMYCLWKFFGNQFLHSIFQNYFKILATTCFKVGLSAAKKVCFIILNKSAFWKKWFMKKCFLFYWKRIFILNIFKFLS